MMSHFLSQPQRQLVDELERLAHEAVRVCLKLQAAYKSLSACPAPGERWDTELRPARKQLWRFYKRLRLARQAYRELRGYDSDGLRTAGQDARVLARGLSRLKREAAGPAAPEDFEDRVELLKSLWDLSWTMLREVKIVLELAERPW